ncbi:aspartyl protease family protein [Leptolyngbya sp. FACHB-541]|uniref:retroviral-like aspartic protease family protein n=1 Tax=Leptolyngbya sp. FACHB-541 TaxID=2692810 RepID=UPI001683F21B|nr:retroviral-like aspartic protease family protein [Leptolyngbya sp. FACHB-541]MBD2001582.1 aspartyl protease family protein [Leptolyngbya sp. FACHB-541]
MGITYAEIELTRGDDLALFREGYIPENRVRRIIVRALVDSGASMLSITPAVRDYLDLPKVDEQQAELADGSVAQFDVVGPVELRFENRKTVEYAIVVPNSPDVLLGAHPLQDLDVLVDPKREVLIVNPKSPDIARKFLK